MMGSLNINLFHLIAQKVFVESLLNGRFGHARVVFSWFEARIRISFCVFQLHRIHTGFLCFYRGFCLLLFGFCCLFWLPPAFPLERESVHDAHLITSLHVPLIKTTPQKTTYPTYIARLLAPAGFFLLFPVT